MSRIFLKVLNMSIAAGWLILAVSVLRLLLKRMPKCVSVLLWGIVALRLICPFSMESALSLIPSAETIPADVLSGPSFQVQTGIESVDRQVNEYLGDRYYEGVTVAAKSGQRFMAVLAAVWVTGAALMLFYMVLSYRRLGRQVETAVLLREGLYQSEYVSSPFVLGIWRPRIYLPFGMEGQELEYVAAHEQAHIRRRDHWWKPFGFLLLSVHWFNPLMWLAYVLLCRDIEMACDERVIKKLEPRRRAEYSRALLTCSVGRGRIAACPLAFGEVGVRERVKSVLNYRKPGIWMAGAAGAVCVIAAVCFLTDPREVSGASAPFGYSYRVSGIIYDAPQFSFTYTVETAPRYCLTADYGLFVSGDMLGGPEEDGSGRWVRWGWFEKVKLTEDNFDGCFKSVDQISGWLDDQETAASLRRGNQGAWRLEEQGEESPVFYYLLQQKNGDVYLAYGYRSMEGESGSGALLRWLFRLERMPGCSVISEDYSGRREDYVELQFYAQTSGGIQLQTEDVQTVRILDSGKLCFVVEGDSDQLIVWEERHGKPGEGAAERRIHELSRNSEGRFELTVSRQSEGNEEVLYLIPAMHEPDGVYAVKIVIVAGPD